jgi:hypothetical protein
VCPLLLATAEAHSVRLLCSIANAFAHKRIRDEALFVRLSALLCAMVLSLLALLVQQYK